MEADDTQLKVKDKEIEICQYTSCRSHKNIPFMQRVRTDNEDDIRTRCTPVYELYKKRIAWLLAKLPNIHSLITLCPMNTETMKNFPSKNRKILDSGTYVDLSIVKKPEVDSLLYDMPFDVKLQ
ncbi:hypothetical protein T07_5876 [Trichinella nelsoni]|uniref:Uncharacterized protein n=2 Tax=Trichinella nelsoni TaxID=6336 RepID=A0A0V0SEQ3_9BILA|nr:hypothetical protein T07_5876 [Trichinella nelsoni]